MYIYIMYMHTHLIKHDSVFLCMIKDEEGGKRTAFLVLLLHVLSCSQTQGVLQEQRSFAVSPWQAEISN